MHNVASVIAYWRHQRGVSNRKELLFSGLDSGARGYALKDGSPRELLDALELVARGGSYVDPRLRPALLSRRSTERLPSLSAREREIFQLIAEARTNKEVAELLEISPATVETHRARILQKLDIHNTAELVLYAVRRGVIS